MLSTCISAYSQPTEYINLTMDPKIRFDKLELYALQSGILLDSSEYFKELDQIKNLAPKKNDPLLQLTSDYLRGLYYLRGKDATPIDVENYLLTLKTRLTAFPQNDLRDIILGNINHYIGLRLLRRDEFSAKTIKYFLEADLLHRGVGYEKVQFGGTFLNDIGQYYQLLALDHTKALKYYNEAEKYIKNDPIDLNRIFFYRSKAKTLVHFKRFEEAIAYNKMGIAQVKLKKDSLRIGSLLGNIGEIILHHNPNPASSEKYFKDELFYRTKYNPKGLDDIAKVYGNLSQVAAIKQNAKLSDSLFSKAMETLKPVSDSITLMAALKSIYLNKVVSDTLLQNYKSAFKYQKLYQQAVDYIYSQDIKKATSNATVQFDTEKFKQEAENASEKNQYFKYWVAIVSLLLVLTLIGTYLIYVIYNNSKKDLARQLEFEKNEAEKLLELDNLKTRFFNNISHELRTPITLIKAPLEELERQTGKSQLTLLMKNNLQKLQNLINQLLDLSKIEAGKMKVNTELEDLGTFTRNLVGSFDSLAVSKGIKLDLSLPEESLVVHFDKDKIEKIINNLISNALKFTSKDGEVFINLQKEGQSVIFSIKDTGEGMAENDLPRIFDRYYQTGNNTALQNTGTGIGLALVKELVNVLEGHILVESKLGQGSEFKVTLPLGIAQQETMPNQAQYASQKAFAEASDQEKTVILIVEDNTDIRNYLTQDLETHYHILTAENGELGLKNAVEYLPDLIITDLMMPVLDGLEMTKEIRKDLRTCHIPVIMLTAKSDLESRIEGFVGGADEYLAKPFSPAELKARINNLLNNRKLLYDKFEIRNKEKEPLDDLNLVFMNQLNQYLEFRLADNTLRMEELAENLKLSSIQLRRKMKAITGINPTEYIRNFRLMKAAKLLKDKNLSVSEVAFQVGFESLSYFSKVFQEKYGKLPSDW